MMILIIRVGLQKYVILEKSLNFAIPSNGASGAEMTHCTFNAAVCSWGEEKMLPISFMQKLQRI